MSRSWVLLTAMPPTKGHLGLMQFAAALTHEVHVIVCTAPDEPFANERYRAVAAAARKISKSVHVHHLHRSLPQDPETPGFWEMWYNIMVFGDYTPLVGVYGGVQADDFIVTSEPYGAKLAQITGATFVPYDPKRELFYTKATDIREDPEFTFDWIMPEFQHHLRFNVVVFGAESTGKTTLSRNLAHAYGGHWFYEYARPYLELVGPDITIESMEAIWRGQRATQAHSYDFYDKPYAFFDTDLFSTVGYWEQPHWSADLGPVPLPLIKDAERYKADLYIIPQANIPFEEDPIRYGGTKQESPDSFWIGIAEKYGLNYVVLESESVYDRRVESMHAIDAAAEKKWSQLAYDRQGF